METLKKSSCCLTTQNIENFYNDQKTKYGKPYYCKYCSKEKKKDYYENHKDEVHKKMAEYRKEKYKNDPEFKQRALEASRRCKAKKKKKEEFEKIE